jgi:hypothetical protein
VLERESGSRDRALDKTIPVVASDVVEVTSETLAMGRETKQLGKSRDEAVAVRRKQRYFLFCFMRGFPIESRVG